MNEHLENMLDDLENLDIDSLKEHFNDYIEANSTISNEEKEDLLF